MSEPVVPLPGSDATDGPPAVEDGLDSGRGEAEPVADLDESPDPAPHGAPGGGRRWKVAVAVLVPVVAALAVVAATLYARLDAERGRTDDVERVAGRFAAAVATYDYRNLEEAKADVLGLSTGAFRNDYESRFEDLKTLLEATKASSTTTVKAVYLGDIEDDQATAFVVVDVETQGTAGRRQLVNEYLELNLVRLSGGWKVDNVRTLNFGRRPSPTGPASPTTAPGAGGGTQPSG